jgi:hypothetical protein
MYDLLHEDSTVEVRRDPDSFERVFVRVPECGAEFEVWGSCPVQAIGGVMGRDLYFRAEHRGWTFDVADCAGNLPSDGYRESDGFFRKGDHRNAGYMSPDEAVEIIAQCLKEYTSTRV